MDKTDGMTKPKSLKEFKEQMCKDMQAKFGDNHDWVRLEIIALEGFEYALTALAETEVEFDEDSVRRELDRRGYCETNSFIVGRYIARWQFDQLKAQLALAKQKARASGDFSKIYQEKINKLEAELAEVKRLFRLCLTENIKALHRMMPLTSPHRVTQDIEELIDYQNEINGVIK